MPKKFQMTQEGKVQLEGELDILLTEKRPEVIERLQVAREFGDLSENSEYDAARDEQASIEARIKAIENMLTNAEIIEKKGNDVVQFGSVVVYKDLTTNAEETFQIVGIAESNPFKGKISTESPVAKALMGHKAGDTAILSLPTNKETTLEIIKVS